MRSYHLWLIAVALAVRCGAQQPSAQFSVTRAIPDIVNVHVSIKPGSETVPKELFGGFLEPIGNSINNGLMAQILVNPSLESGLWDHVNEERLYTVEPKLAELGSVRGLPLPWLPWSEKAGNRYELRVGHAANSYQSLGLFGLPGEEVGILQRVYLPMHRTPHYVATAYARNLGDSEGVLTFALQNGSGKVVSRSAGTVNNAVWTKVAVDLTVPARAIAPGERAAFGVFTGDGSRIEIDQITLTPADAVDGLDPDVLALAKTMGMTELRLGGNFTSFYHWRDGVGEPDKRLVSMNIGWGIPEYNNFGTDEFLDLCRRLEVVPQVDINMGTGTPEEAAEWVRYIRSRTSVPVIWELGNELWGPWQVAPPSLAQLPARTLAFSRAVKAASPGDTVIATGSNTTQYNEWNSAELTLPPGTFDLLSLHFVETSGRDTLWQPRTEASTLMVYAKSFHLGEVFAPMLAEVQASDHRNHVHFAMTEWLFHSMGEREGDFRNDFPSWMNLGGAVAAGGFFNTLLRHTAAVKLADMTGMIDFAGIAKERERVYAQPAFYVFQMYSAVKGERVLAVQTNSGTYRITDPRYLFPKGGDVPFVDAVATMAPDGSSISVFLVNRSLQAASAKLNIPGWRASHVTLTQLSGTETFAKNSEDLPRTIVPVSQPMVPEAVVRLPAQSVTRVTLRR